MSHDDTPPANPPTDNPPTNPPADPPAQPPADPPAPLRNDPPANDDGDRVSRLENAVENLTETVTGLIDALTGSGTEREDTPTSVPWTHRGGKHK